MRLDPKMRTIVFGGLAGVAAVALVVAILAVVLAFDAAQAWLIASLVVLLLVVGAEVILLALDRSGPKEETYEFVIEDDGVAPR